MVKLLGSCKVANPIYDELMEEHLGQNLTSSVAVSNMQFLKGHFFPQLLCLYCNLSNTGRPQNMANSALLSIHRMQCVTTKPHHSLGLLLVRAQKATNTLKLPKWTADTTCPVPQPCVLEVVEFKVEFKVEC